MFSLGAMLVTLSYLTPREQVYMQSLNHWWYKIGVGRVQASLPIRKLPNRYHKIQKLKETPSKKEYLVKSTQDGSLAKFTIFSKEESRKKHLLEVKSVCLRLRHPNLCRLI